MAVVPAIPLVSPDEYLISSYRPDMEYVDGVLVERGVPTIAHGLLQYLLVLYLEQFCKQFRFQALPEVRTQIIERARYRIPDLMVCPLPISPGKVIATVPWVVIEILSPDDRFAEVIARSQDYSNIGVRHILLLDAEEQVAYRYEDRALNPIKLTSLALPTGDMPFDTAGLFRQLTERKQWVSG